MEKPDKLQVTMSNIHMISHVDNVRHRCDVMRIVLYLCGLHFQNQWPQCNREESISQLSLEGWSTKLLAGTPQSCQGHQRKWMSENCENTYKETWWLSAMWLLEENLKGKRTGGTNWGNVSKLQTLINNQLIKIIPSPWVGAPT